MDTPEGRALDSLPEHTTHMGCMGPPGSTLLQTTLISGHFKFRSGDTEERAMETVERFYGSLKAWIGEIYHPERVTARWDAAKEHIPVYIKE